MAFCSHASCDGGQFEEGGPRAAAELQAEGYVADISIRGRSYLLHIEYDDGDEAAIIRRCETLGYAPP
jgi:hypothetical protein